jgi:dipeptidyl-peptidase-4
LLTPGPYDVIRVIQIDQDAGWAYFLASPDNPTQRYLHRARLDGSGITERITPTDQPGTHDYQIAPNARYAFHTAGRFTSPPATTLITLPQHKPLRLLEDNKHIRLALDKLAKPLIEFFRLQIEDDLALDAWCMKPPDFDPQQKYPLLFHVYGEPAGQTVVDTWGRKHKLWHMMLAQQGFIIISLDNRGTPAPRGRRWRKSIYRRVGILTAADQAQAAQQLVAERPYIDPQRIGVWGWSGGGSMTLNLMFKYPGIYKTGIAVAAVSDQRYYDTIYQERYMGLPDDNEEGYTKGSPISFAGQLDGNLLLVHGTADDNVHYQCFEALVNELVKNDKHFQMMAYPNRSHSIKEGKNTLNHLYSLMTRYLRDNLMNLE